MSGDETREPSREERVEQALTDAPVGQILQSQAPEPSKSGLVRSGVTVMLFAAAANGLNVVFHFAVARFLPPAEYALLTTIFAINIIATVPLIAVQATVAREMAILLGSGDVETAGAVLRTTYGSASEVRPGPDGRARPPISTCDRRATLAEIRPESLRPTVPCPDRGGWGRGDAPQARVGIQFSRSLAGTRRRCSPRGDRRC